MTFGPQLYAQVAVCVCHVTVSLATVKPQTLTVRVSQLKVHLDDANQPFLEPLNSCVMLHASCNLS